MSTIMIQATDGRPHEIEIESVVYSETIKDMLDVLKSPEPDEVISIPGVPDKVLIQIIEWLNYCHYNSLPSKTPEIERDLEQWKNRFLQQNANTLIELLKAANYLNIKTLLDATSSQLANIISGKTPEAIRAEFGIADDLTREQKKEIRRENDLCGVSRS
ncbi:S-phase kinase-associated protein 1-like [Chelonus insularis]|uniref:S-phase kinase-associated protein 1-like n=1 Tax=Chelonus insularis TaxID=460826 RepID=UPI00158F33BE|nr:S-phase kinase-associated protein 1-like [Chelonus insularis]